MRKKIISLSLLVLLILFGVSTSMVNASTVTGDLNTGLNSNAGNMDGIVIVAPTPSPAAGTYTSAQSVTLTAAGSTAICYTVDGSTPGCTNATTCSAGSLYSGVISVSSSKTIKSLACYNNNSAGPVASSAYTINISSGGGGGGGGGSTTYCSAVTYSAWGACVGGQQNRSVASQSPSGCTLTTTQQISLQQTCTTTVTPPVTEPTNPETPATPPSSNIINDILSEAGVVSSGNPDDLMSHLSNTREESRESIGATKYGKILGLDKKLTRDELDAIVRFIVYGTRTTQVLGEGERAGVINSYFQAYSKLPNTEEEWADVIKIANGRWPVERSTKAENQAKIEFRKVYARNANLSNNIDENAIMVIAYGLLPSQRNLNSEKVAIKTFKWVYKHAPVNALAWNIVRAIAYSGATR